MADPPADSSSAPPIRNEAAAACRRLCSAAPVVTTSIVLGLYATTLWSGWLEPVGLVWHGRLEAAAFTLEVLLLITSYVTTIIRGPGFVPKGWEPAPEEIQRRGAPAEHRPLNAALSAPDCLQFCQRCSGYKPPRAHHCSTCGRCVLWMDHHCPWTNTCIGHRNLRTFTQFTHYVALACLHSFYIQSEAPVKLALLLYRKKHGKVWYFLIRPRTVFALVSWVADLIIAILVGSLAWDMHWTLGRNVTMVEELVVEKAELRRTAFGERPFLFPYNVGSRENWQLVMGSRLWSWLLPLGGPFCDAIWPPLRTGCGNFDLSTEQLAQKAMKFSKSQVMPVDRSYDGRWGCISGSVCRCYYWVFMAWRFGCGTACSGPGCDETHLTVRAGDEVMVSYREECWVMGRAIPAGADGPEGPEGWLPCSCLDPCKARKFEVPHQRELQGKWTTHAGPAAVSGPVVTMGISGQQGAYVIRAEEQEATLLGCRLQECDGTTARWSNGDVWHRVRPSVDASAEDAAWAFGRRPAEAKKDL